MRIKTSKRIDEISDYLNNLYKFKYDGIISRIAFTYSLQLNIKFDLVDETHVVSDGKDWRDDRALFGASSSFRSNLPIYKTLLIQHYERSLLDDEFVLLFKRHLSFGLEKIYNDLDGKNIAGGYHIQYLMTLVKNGLTVVRKSNVPFGNSKIETVKIESSDRLISFDIGSTENGESVIINLNKDFEPQHIAIAGMTRSGKTELVKHILYQIHQVSNKELKFIFLDYKGEGQSEALSKFLKSTDCEFIDISKAPFEFNPLASIEQKIKHIQDLDITALVDAIASVDTTKLGVSQQHLLKTVISDCFGEKRGKLPTFQNVFEAISNYYEENNKNPDTLYSIIEKLSTVFKEPIDYNNKIYSKNLYLNLPATASDTYRKATVFSVLKYLFFEFIKSDTVVQNEEGVKPLKYIIVVDEAHVYMKDKSSRKVLEDFLRLISSKGVAVVLLSQGVEDYKHKDFDFVSQIKIPICLNINNKDYNLIQSFIGTPKSKPKLQDAINKLIPSNDYKKGLINFNEPVIINVKQFWQTIK
jgi:DNA sulfur modification protein DndE